MIGVLSVIGVLLAAVLWLYVYAKWFYVPDTRSSSQPDPGRQESPWMS
jgi:hypothetical protein